MYVATAEALKKLTDGIAQLERLGKGEAVNKLTDAVYVLASYLISCDFSPSAPKDKLDEIKDQLIIGNILDKAHEIKNEKICECLAELCKQNSNLNDSIDRQYTFVNKAESLFDTIKNPYIKENIDKIYTLKGM